MLCGVELVDVCVENIESVGIPESAHKLALTLFNCLCVEAVGKPGGGVCVEIPADCVCAVLFEGVEGVYCVALGFRHLLTVFVLNKTENDDVLIGGLIKEKGRDCEKRIEPASCLVNSLGDEFCGELLLEEVFVFKGIVMLCEGHCA